MDEQKIIKDLTEQGYENVYVYNAPPEEVDEEHQHDFDSRLIVLSGRINITSPVNGIVMNMSHSQGSDVTIVRNTPHVAKVGPEGCRYVIAEKH